MSKKFEAHLFVCTHGRTDGSASCAPKGALALRDSLKLACKERTEWKGRVRVNASGCLDQCEHGMAAVIYPHAEWLTDLKTGDESRVMTELSKILDQK